MTKTTELTVYQTGLLYSMVEAPVPMALLPVPDKTDRYDVGLTLQGNVDAANQLVTLGLLENLTSEFREPIYNHYMSTGRRFMAYGLTLIGLQLFNNQPERVN